MSFLDLDIILKVYFISLLWQLISWPAVSWYFKGLNDRGWAISRIVSTLLISLIIWQLGNIGFRVNTNQGLVAVTILFLVLSVFVYIKTRVNGRIDIIPSAKYIGIEEYLFIVGLVFMTVTRGFAPEIHTLEKFMDFGFINRYLVSSSLPTTDMWFAGSIINYYSFGHFWASILIRFLGVSPAVGYNLVLGVIAGLTMSMTFSLVTNLIHKGESGKIVGGIIASIGVTLGGNSHALWYFLTNKLSMANYWYADATRFIHNTIHEFPSYSLVVSDLHGHLLDLPVVLLFLFIFYYWTINRGILEEIIMGGVFGIMMMTNTWDLPIYGMLLGIYCLVSLASRKISITEVLRVFFLVVLSIIIVAVPWWISFEPISSGIGLVQMRSPVWQIMALWLGGFIALIMASVTARKSKNKLIIWSLSIGAFLLILIPELIYAKDIYPNHPRANTMFKLTYQAFILMGISLGVAVGQLMQMKRNLLKFMGIFSCLLLFSGSMIFPLYAFPTFYNDYKTYKGLNGEEWLKNDLPERYAVIEYLKKYRDTRNLVEAVGDSYTNFNTVSVFSGVPTVVGWKVHEWLWRGGYQKVGERDGEVKSFYEDNDTVKTVEFIKKYNIGWIVVGGDENEKYSVNDKKIKQLGQVVLKNGNTYLVKVK